MDDKPARMLDFFNKHKLRKQLRSYLTREAVRDVLEGRTLDGPKINPGRIEFIFAFVRADTPERLAERLGLVADAGMEHEAVVHDIVGPMVVMAFGTLTPGEPSGSRHRLVSRLQQQLGADIKIVHGAVDGHFGLFGSDKRLAFTLGRLEFGRVEEFHAMRCVF